MASPSDLVLQVDIGIEVDVMSSGQGKKILARMIPANPCLGHGQRQLVTDEVGEER